MNKPERLGAAAAAIVATALAAPGCDRNPDAADKMVQLLHQYQSEVGAICDDLIGEHAPAGVVHYQLGDAIDSGGAIIGRRPDVPTEAVACSAGFNLDEANGDATAKAIGRLAQAHKNAGVGGNFEFCVQSSPEEEIFETPEAVAFVSAVRVKLGKCEGSSPTTTGD